MRRPSTLHTIPGPTDARAIFHQDQLAAVNQLFHLYYKELCLYVDDFVDQMQTAEEIVDDAFLKLWKQIGLTSFSTLEAARSFLWVVAKNAAINYLRNEKRFRKKKRAFDSTSTLLLDQQPAGEDYSLTWARLINEVDDAIQQLPEQQRQVIRLNQKGLSTAQIAETMGLSPQTVRNYYGKAILGLKRKLSGAAFGFLIVDLLQKWMW